MKKRNLLFAFYLFSLPALSSNDPAPQPDAPAASDPRRATGQQPRARNWGPPIFPKITSKESKAPSHIVGANELEEAIIHGRQPRHLDVLNHHSKRSPGLDINQGTYKKLAKILKNSKGSLSKFELLEESGALTASEKKRQEKHKKDLAKHLKSSHKQISTFSVEYEHPDNGGRDDPDTLAGELLKTPLLKHLHKVKKLEVFLPDHVSLKKVFHPLRGMATPPHSLATRGGELIKKDTTSLTTFFRRLKARPQKKRHYTFSAVDFKDQESFQKIASLITQGGISEASLAYSSLENITDLSPLFQENTFEKLNLLNVILPRNDSSSLPPASTFTGLKELSIPARVRPLKGLSNLEALTLTQEEGQRMKLSLGGWLAGKKLKKLGIEGGVLRRENFAFNLDFFKARFLAESTFHLKDVFMGDSETFNSLGALVCASSITEFRLENCEFRFPQLFFLYQKSSLKKLMLLDNTFEEDAIHEDEAGEKDPKIRPFIHDQTLNGFPRLNQTLEEIHYSTGRTAIGYLKEAKCLAHWAAGHKPLKTLVIKMEPETLKAFYEALTSCPQENFPSLSSLIIEPYDPFLIPNEKLFNKLKERITHIFFPQISEVPALALPMQAAPLTRMAPSAAEEHFPAGIESLPSHLCKDPTS